MATRKQLTERWASSDGLRINQQIDDYLSEEDRYFCEHKHPHGQSSDIAEILKGLPYVEEIPGGLDMRGISIWNNVRKFDFSGWDFSLAAMQLSMPNCIFIGSRFDRTTNSGSMSGSQYRDSYLGGANFSGVIAQRVVAINCCFDNASLRAVRFDDADLSGCSFVNAKCQRANFAGADLRGCNFQGANLDGTVLVGGKIDKTTNLSGASLINVNYEAGYNDDGSPAWAENDWRQATYDDTTIHGDHPAVLQQALLKNLIAVLEEDGSPDAKAIIPKLKAARPLIPKEPDNWIGTVFQAITAEQTKVLESAMFDAVKLAGL